MNKQQYQQHLEVLKQIKIETDAQIRDLKDEYIVNCKPCAVNDSVIITLGSGRKVKGVAKTLGILSDGNVHVTSYKDGSKTKYITTPTQHTEAVSPSTLITIE